MQSDGIILSADETFREIYGPAENALDTVDKRSVAYISRMMTMLGEPDCPVSFHTTLVTLDRDSKPLMVRARLTAAARIDGIIWIAVRGWLPQVETEQHAHVS